MTFPFGSIKGLGYSAIDAQLFSVPPYAVAAVLTGPYMTQPWKFPVDSRFSLFVYALAVIAAFVSDRYRIRGPVMLCFIPLSIIGYAVIRTTEHNKVKYGALFLMASGLYPAGEYTFFFGQRSRWSRASG